MEIQIDGKSLSEFAPDAARYFATEETLRSMGVVALIQSVSRLYEARIKVLEVSLKATLQDKNDLSILTDELKHTIDVLQAKVSHRKQPKSGRFASGRAGLRKNEMPEDADETTQELLDEAYEPSKSEMRRHAAMKKSGVKSGK